MGKHSPVGTIHSEYLPVQQCVLSFAFQGRMDPVKIVAKNSDSCSRHYGDNCLYCVWLLKGFLFSLSLSAEMPNLHFLS